MFQNTDKGRKKITMGLIRFIQAHNRNKELKGMRQLKEQELDVLENREWNDTRKPSVSRNMNEHKQRNQDSSMAECESCEDLFSSDALEVYDVDGKELYLCEECWKKVNEKTKEITKTEDEAIKVIKLRYAKGEITKEEFEEMKKNLR